MGLQDYQRVQFRLRTQAKNCTQLHRCNMSSWKGHHPRLLPVIKDPPVFSPYGLLFSPWKVGNLTEPGSEWCSVRREVHFNETHHQSLRLLGVPGNCKSNIRFGVFLGKGRNVTEDFPAVRNALLNH